MNCPINFKLNRVIGTTRAWLLSKLGLVHLPILGSSKIFWFPDTNSKMLCPITLEQGNWPPPGLGCFQIGVGSFARFGLVLI